MNRFLSRPVRVAAAAVLAAGMLAQASSQDDRSRTVRQPHPTFRVASNLVVADVTVRDRKGNLVGDLTQDDFTIFEDNVKQQIVLFSLESIPAGPATPEPGAATSDVSTPAPTVNFGTTETPERRKELVQDKRLIVLFFDLSSLSTEDLVRSVKTAEGFVAERSTPHDLLAIATYSSTLQLVQDLTNDRDLLLKTLKQLDPTEAGDAAEEELGEVESSEEVFVPDEIQFNVFNTDRRLSAIETLAKGYREFPERKSLIYFSGGVKTTGIENQSQIRSTVDAANQSNLSIYTVDSRGLVAMPPGGGASRGSPGGRALLSGDSVSRQSANLSNSQETLTTLSHDTGGTAFQDTNELRPVFDKVLADTQTYYVLGYFSSNSREDGKFRKIRIETRRPELKLQHRPGYFASKQFTRLTQSERDRQLEEALNVDRPFSELPFILQADYFKDDGTNSLVPITVQLAGDGVQFEERGEQRVAQFEFLARITGSGGRIAGVARDVVQVRLPLQKAEKIRAGQILYSTGFELRPGAYHLKFLIRDNRSGKLGSFEQSLGVPELTGTKLQISSVVLGSRLVSVKENSQGVERRDFAPRFRGLEAKRDPLVLDDRKVVPSIGNVFLNRQTMFVYFQVYGATEGTENKRPSLETHLLFLHNRTKALESQPHMVSEWAREGKGVANVAMTVPLRSLKKGEYTLQIHVRDNVSDRNLFQRVPLMIE